MKVGVVADDLTGAADSGVQFARAGYRAAVLFRGERPTPFDRLDAVAMDTDSRSLLADEARRRVAEAIEAVRDARILIKKLDSTLRGPVAAELAAALEASGRRIAIVAPAFPGAGRTTRHGTQLVHGVPVQETEFAQDPRTPVEEGHLPSVLRRGGLRDVGTLSVEGLGDVARVAEAIASGRWTVADADADEDLDTLVRAVAEASGDPSRILWAGSAGLAAALGRAYPGPQKRGMGSPISRGGRVVVVVGSASGVARQQVRALVGGEDLTEAVLGREALRVARASLEGGGSVVLRPEAERGDPSAVVAGLAGVVAELSRRDLFDALIMTGGETAVGVARTLGARGILLGDEVESGVPMGTLIGPRPYPVVTKAGGFGGPETLRQAWRLMAGEDVP